jgi:hypothetical protein
MQFKPYAKIIGLHKEEVEGILTGTCYIQEKIDGANASILGDDGIIHCGSRTRDLTLAGDGFNGFVNYVKNHEGINEFFKKYIGCRLYGEWLVRHSIGYDEVNYRQFYLYDIESPIGGKLPINMLYILAESYSINTAHLFGRIENPTLEQIKEFAGKSVLGNKGEGVVVKNLKFINKFGDCPYGKYVTQEFKEDNAITFGGNNKFSETYNEMYFVNQFITMPRLEKIINKLKNTTEEKLDFKHIPQVMGMMYHDVITEEGWAIAKEMGKQNQIFSFRSLEQLCTRKTRQMFINFITGDISVADK